MSRKSIQEYNDLWGISIWKVSNFGGKCGIPNHEVPPLPKHCYALVSASNLHEGQDSWHNFPVYPGEQKHLNDPSWSLQTPFFWHGLGLHPTNSQDGPWWPGKHWHTSLSFPIMINKSANRISIHKSSCTIYILLVKAPLKTQGTQIQAHEPIISTFRTELESLFLIYTYTERVLISIKFHFDRLFRDDRLI